MIKAVTTKTEMYSVVCDKCNKESGSYFHKDKSIKRALEMSFQYIESFWLCKPCVNELILPHMNTLKVGDVVEGIGCYAGSFYTIKGFNYRQGKIIPDFSKYYHDPYNFNELPLSFDSVKKKENTK